MIVDELINKFFVFFKTHIFYQRLQKPPQVDMFYSQMNPAHVLAVRFSTIRFNIILMYVRFVEANTICCLFK
jgi:hypothetical protein